MNFSGTGSSTLVAWCLPQDPDQIAALKDWQAPTNVKELRKFLGFAGYYRRFLENYYKIIRPLNDLLVGKQKKEQV